MTSVVYFLLRSDGRIKIGWASQLERRLRELSRAEGERLTVLATASGGPALEAELHRRFAADRVHGEWFNASLALNQIIEECRQGQPLAVGAKRHLPLAWMFAPLDRLATNEDSLALARPLVEALVEYQASAGFRLPAYALVGKLIGTKSGWIRKLLAGSEDVKLPAHVFGNILIAYRDMQIALQVEAEEQLRLTASRREDAERVLTLMWPVATSTAGVSRG